MGILAWDEERDSAALLQSLLGGTTTRRDPGGGAVQLHDFDLLLPDDRVVAVEVTRLNDPEYLATRGAVDRLDWSSSELEFDWSVGMIRRFDVKMLHRSVFGLLRRLETEGVEPRLLTKPTEGGPAFEARVDLYDLGARSAYHLAAAEPDKAAVVILNEIPQGGATSVESYSTVRYSCGQRPRAASGPGPRDRGYRHLEDAVAGPGPEHYSRPLSGDLAADFAGYRAHRLPDAAVIIAQAAGAADDSPIRGSRMHNLALAHVDVGRSGRSVGAARPVHSSASAARSRLAVQR